MRICHVVYGYYPQDMRPRRASESMHLRGHEVHVISMTDQGEPHEEQVSGVWVHRFPFQVTRGGRARYIFQYATFLLASTAMLFRLNTLRKFDIVHVHSLPDFQILCALPEKLLGAKIVLDLHEAMPELFAARFRTPLNSVMVRLVSTVELLSCGFADRIVVVDEAMRRRLIAKGVEDHKIVVVMNSPPLDSTAEEMTARSRKSLGIGEGRMIVYMGGINRERDLTTLIRAVAKLQPAYHLGLTMIGHGEELFRAELVSLAEREGLNGFSLRNRVPHSEAFRFIRWSDIGAITYERNALTELAMPTKALEYTAAGKPLVIANLPAIREIYGDAALYYESGDPSDLAGQIARIFDEPQLAKQLVAKAKEILDKYSWKVMEARLVALYQQVLSMAEFGSTASRESAS